MKNPPSLDNSGGDSNTFVTAREEIISPTTSIFSHPGNCNEEIKNKKNGTSSKLSQSHGLGHYSGQGLGTSTNVEDRSSNVQKKIMRKVKISDNDEQINVKKKPLDTVNKVILKKNNVEVLVKPRKSQRIMTTSLKKLEPEPENFQRGKLNNLDNADDIEGSGLNVENSNNNTRPNSNNNNSGYNDQLLREEANRVERSEELPAFSRGIENAADLIDSTRMIVSFIDHSVNKERESWARRVWVGDYTIVSGNNATSTVLNDPSSSWWWFLGIGAMLGRRPGIGMGAGSAAYVVWTILIETVQYGTNIVLYKRYTDFVRLRQELTNDFSGKYANAIPPLPVKSAVERFRPGFLEKRRQGLEYFLSCVLLNPLLSNSKAVLNFVRN